MNKTGQTSEMWFARARRVISGGVNSPVRAWSQVGGSPRFVASASASRIRDVEGREYVDYIGSWGPMICGHAQASVVDAISQTARRGTSFGAATAAEVEFAERICARIPSIERVRLVSSGTEATMSALRLARAATGRDGIIKFAGCYHGHSDGLLVRAGSGAMTHGVPDSPGVPKSVGDLTRVAVFNDAESVNRLCDSNVAAVIVEPVAGNMGVVPPDPQFLEDLRSITHERGALLVFDEVMTGFRLGPAGYQSLTDVRPDLTTLGKIIGGGLPLAAYGGRADLMDQISPAGPVYQAGTLSGNPLAVAAGMATLDLLEGEEPYERLEHASAYLEEGLKDALGTRPGCVQRVGSMLTLFFGPGSVRNFEDAMTCDTERFGRFFSALIEEGIWIPPSQFEAWFVSLAHTREDLDATISAAGRALHAID
ncbi:MAG TPA: glutamate-1-semialdehyde 2,1-aminomutase [Candidatus Limnocylindrales bacterium]|nr:glutamate-1-semialdehyde 2,1-aminomutase [Candidatus Limnocylindrales bacterium]